jgi:hypothetical protein
MLADENNDIIYMNDAADMTSSQQKDGTMAFTVSCLRCLARPD